MTEQEQKKLDAVYEYCKQEQEFWEEQADTVKGAIITAFISAPVLLGLGLLLQWLAPEFWEQLLKVLSLA